MKNFHGKYETICEAALGRYNMNGFLAGEYVKIKKDALKGEHAKSFTKQMQSMIESIQKSDVVLRISYIKSSASEAMNGPVGAPNVPGCLWADVVVEYAPGMWKDPMTLPLSMLEKVELDSESSTGDTGMSGYAQYSPSILRPDHTQIKPVEVKATNNRETTSDEDHNLTKKNTKLANTKAPKAAKFDKPKQINASVDKSWNKDIDMLEEAYKSVQGNKSDIKTNTPEEASTTEFVDKSWSKDVNMLEEAYKKINKPS